MMKDEMLFWEICCQISIYGILNMEPWRTLWDFNVKVLIIIDSITDKKGDTDKVVFLLQNSFI